MPAVGMTDGLIRLSPCARDHRAVVLSCSHLASIEVWPVLERRSAWLVVDTKVKACSRETPQS